MSHWREKQSRMFRDPAQVVGLWSESGFNPKLLEVEADKGWKETLKRLDVTLLISREYEHLVLGLSHQQTTWLHVPHPSGLVVDRPNKTIHLACTRNPNLLMELRGEKLLPTRVRFLPGSLYLHELALIGKNLYGNAVGQNAIVRLDYDRGAQKVWWPNCISNSNQGFHRNYLQLNSIAAGKTLKDSFFTASSGRILKQIPGEPNFPVDHRGVLFSGRTGEPVAWGLTRPHSARLHRSELWVNNSGYGEVGRIREGCFESLAKLESWTRGLCFVKDVLFVGLSRVLPRFQTYAPGLNIRKSHCGIVALDPSNGRILGKIIWPYGNQIFSIDWMKGARLPFDGKNDPRKHFYSFGP